MAEIITRKQAKKRGLTRYYTGKPCPRGHVAERLVAGYGCIVCSKMFKKRYAAANRKKINETHRKWVARNREYHLIRRRKWHGENREKINRQSHEWRLQNRERLNAKARERRQINREKLTNQGKLKRQRIKEALAILRNVGYPI